MHTYMYPNIAYSAPDPSSKAHVLTHVMLNSLNDGNTISTNINAKLLLKILKNSGSNWDSNAMHKRKKGLGNMGQGWKCKERCYNVIMNCDRGKRDKTAYNVAQPCLRTQ